MLLLPLLLLLPLDVEKDVDSFSTAVGGTMLGSSPTSAAWMGDGGGVLLDSSAEGSWRIWAVLRSKMA